MSIKRAPLKTDAEGKCTRWRVILYNRATHKQEWHTIEGTKGEAQAFERQQRERMRTGVYIAKAKRCTLREVHDAFLREREQRGRRTSTLASYRTVFKRLVERFGDHEVGSLRRADFGEFFEALLAGGATSQIVNASIRGAKALLFFAIERELVERNVLQRFRPYARTEHDRRVNRDAYTETELRALLDAARPEERAFIATLALTGMRPGEAYALRVCDLDLNAGTAVIARSWDHRGLKFVAPKTKAGERVVALASWLREQLCAHINRTGAADEALVFGARNGMPLDPSNVRRNIWKKLVQRAGVRYLDMYSLRSTFATLGRASGEAAFNMARAMGHSKSTLVDQVYARTLPSGLAGVAQAVESRALGTKPQLRVIEGGAERDVRETLDDSVSGAAKERVTA